MSASQDHPLDRLAVSYGRYAYEPVPGHGAQPRQVYRLDVNLDMEGTAECLVIELSTGYLIIWAGSSHGVSNLPTNFARALNLAA